jgi:Protein of unknown function (DUF3467)
MSEFSANQLPKTASGDFKAIYSNAARLGITPWDINIMFFMIQEPAGGGAPTLEDQMLVKMSPQHFKAFGKAMERVLAGYEAQFGTVSVPEDSP